MRVTAVSGGIGGARFLRGLLSVLDQADEVTVVANTADDIWLFGLKICPDLDTLMYTLGGGIDESRGWGRAQESWHAKEELAAYGVQPDWFGLGDRDLATHVVRTQMLAAGYPLSAVTAALCERWKPGVRLLPMSDDRVETHVVIEDATAAAGRRAVHFQEYWVRLHAEPAVRDVVVVGLDRSEPAPGVLEAIGAADVVLLPPSNPVVSVGTVLGVPTLADALRSHDWAAFARGYNGPHYASHGYDRKLAERFAWWSRKPDMPWRPGATPPSQAPTGGLWSRLAAWLRRFSGRPS